MERRDFLCSGILLASAGLAASEPFLLPPKSHDKSIEAGEFSSSGIYEINAITLRNMIHRTIFAAEQKRDEQRHRYSLNGVLFEINDDTITAVGTDGSRLAAQSETIKNTGSHNAESVIISLDFLHRLHSALANFHNQVSLVVGDGRAIFRFGNREIYARLVEGRYPRWQQLFPDPETQTRIDFVVGDLFLIVRQAHPQSCIRTVLNDNHFVLHVNGKPSIQLPVAYTNGRIEQTFDPGYFIVALSILDRNNRIAIMLGGGVDAPIEMKTVDGFSYLAVPCSLQSTS